MSFKPIPTLSGTQANFTGNISAGNIAVTGTVDGRDVATDGTKLDGIEASADVTDTANVTSAGALMDSEVTNLAQVKAFDSSDYATAAQGTLATNALPKSAGTLTGKLTISTATDEMLTLNASDDGPVYMSFERSFDRHAYVGFGSNGDSFYIANEESGGDLLFTTSGSERLRINSSGNVGIGTTSPSSLLHLASTGPAVLTIEADTDNVTETDNARIVLKQDGALVVGRIGYENDTNALEIINEFNDSLSLGTNNSKRLIINSSGDVGIGTTSPSEKLHVVGKVLADNLFTPQWVTPLMLGACNTNTSGSGSVTSEGKGVTLAAGAGATDSAAIRLDRYFAAARGSGQTTRLDFWNTIVGIGFQRVLVDDTEFFIEIGVAGSPVGPPSDSDKGIFFCLKRVGSAYTYDIRHNRGTAETNTTAVDQSTSFNLSFKFSVEIRTLKTGTLQLYISNDGDEPTLVQEFTGLTFGQNGTTSQHEVWAGYRSIGRTSGNHFVGANSGYVGYWKN